MNRGFLYALVAYIMWGLLPIYWKLLHSVSAAAVLSHRMVWSLVIVALILTVRKEWAWIRRVDRKAVLTFLAVAVLLIINWYTYIWAINQGFIVESSLGYFINPLVNVLLGGLFLGERLRPVQKVAIAIACGGVLYLTLNLGALPWIALTLAFSFGFYGLLKKTAGLNALEGMGLEMAILSVPALAYLLLSGDPASPSLLTGTPYISAMLVGTGIVTAIPLLAFAAAARRLTLTTLGLIQYLAPTLQFLIGVFVYGEDFTPARAVGFVLIWIALAIYSGETILRHRQRSQRQALMAKAVAAD
ncbi:MAG: EamA family transporter RarD [Caldilineaceae bacterium]|nr:EamA family transporter RarD [Caldilineaceae bacterium]HRJ45353.1 EamA family transporter RarD [Caldilineaceae bacterium]